MLCFFPLIETFSATSEAALGAVSHTDAVRHLNSLPDPDEPAAASVSAPDEPAAAPASDSVKASPGEALDIVFDHASFAYDGERSPVVRDIELSIPAGQKVALLGRSGAGKSTLALLVRGEARPCAGRVLVGGVPADELAHAQHPQVGVIGQYPHLFNQTLRENLLIGRADAADADLVAALEAVGLGELLARLPHGLDTVVDESGRRFSGGERHRIALARVLVARTPVVVLDEPFAGLDPATESALLDVILDVLAARTVILITHHLQGVARLDRAVFVEGGRITLDGAPAALARDSARYRQLLAFEHPNVPVA